MSFSEGEHTDINEECGGNEKDEHVPGEVILAKKLHIKGTLREKS